VGHRHNRQLGRLIRELRIDLTIATRRLDYVVCGALARIMGIKNVLRPGIIRRPWMPIWHRLVYGRLNHGIIVNADGIREVLLDYLPIKPAKVRTIRSRRHTAENPGSRSAAGTVPNHERRLAQPEKGPSGTDPGGSTPVPQQACSHKT
jgi:hypothetical protein